MIESKFNLFICDLEINIKDAMRMLDENAQQILLVAQNARLVGIITDGDIRRHILCGGDLDASIKIAMNSNPRYIFNNQRNEALAIMKAMKIRALPVVNESHEIIDLIFEDEISKVTEQSATLDQSVVIMAGGKGTRLYPYTKILPKPLIPIDETPIVERILNEFRTYGTETFFLSVNYKANMIKSYFDDTAYSEKIRYVVEDVPLGTAGALSLIREQLTTPFYMTNCDILVKANYVDILKHHKTTKNVITIVSSLKNIQIPYGVFELNNDASILSMKEKPSLDFLVNTGFYVIDPIVIDLMPSGDAYDMTDLITAAMNKGMKVGLYPIGENAWMDMGQLAEMKKMINYFEKME